MFNFFVYFIEWGVRLYRSWKLSTVIDYFLSAQSLCGFRLVFFSSRLPRGFDNIINITHANIKI